MSAYERTAMMLQRGKAMYEVFFSFAGEHVSHVGPFHSRREAKSYAKRYIRGVPGKRLVYKIKTYGVDFNRSRKNAPVKIRRVGGAQAEGARRLGLVKVDRASAERLWNAGVQIVVVGSNVNDFHFFKGWHLAMQTDPDRISSEGLTFSQFANNWSYYNEDPETGKIAFFMYEKDLR